MNCGQCAKLLVLPKSAVVAVLNSPDFSRCLPTSTGDGVLLLNVTGYGSVGIFFTIAIGLELGFSFTSAILNKGN